MQRIAVIGCGGSGKTTLANELAARLGIPVVHIDSHYWQQRDGRRVESTPEEWTARHRELISQPTWIIDGMKLGVLPERLQRADTVIYLDMPTRTCLAGILRRRLRHRGQERPDLGVYDRINWEFVRWVCLFRRRQRPVLLDQLNGTEGEVIIIRRRRDASRIPKLLAARTDPVPAPLSIPAAGPARRPPDRASDDAQGTAA